MNYECKYSAEVQSVYFGGSRRQVAPHTGVCYNRIQVIPFCSISENARHGAAAVWAHTKVILDYMKSVSPGVKKCTL